MIKSTTRIIDIDKIVIPQHFRRSLPAEQKIAERYSFYKRTGSLDREILVDENYNLIDGYAAYLVCKMLGLKKVRVLCIQVRLTAKECLNLASAALERIT